MEPGYSQWSHGRKVATVHVPYTYRAQAARYFREMLKLRELQEVSGETQEALLFLAYYCKDTGELQEAQQHCSRLLDIGGQERDEAKALLRDIRSQSQYGQLTPST